MSGSSFSFLLRPRWIAFHLLVVIGIALMLWAAFWQLDRLDQRKTFNAVVEGRIDLPAVPLDELLATSTDPIDLEWRQVTMSGVFQPEQIVWFNRSQDGLAGDNVLAALDRDSTADQVAPGAPVVIVNRGFVMLGATIAAPPTGTVEILGRIRVPQERQRGQLTDAGDGPVVEVRRIDLEQLDAQIDGDVAPFYVDLMGSVPNVTGADPTPVPEPSLDDGPHFSYAVQWFIFATAVLVGWVLAVRRSIRSRRRGALTASATEPTSPDYDQPDDVEAANSTTGTGAPSRH
jgi:cytochrome oxidase assembly protein ShyY1